MKKKLLGGLLLAFVSPAVLAAAAAGQVTMQTGSGSALAADGGSVRPLAKGDGVMSGETLVTGPNSYLGVKFSDGGSVVLRPNTRFQIENYKYGPDTAPKAATAPAPAAPPSASAAGSGVRITSVSPSPVRASKWAQPITVTGAGFKPGARLVLLDTATGKRYVRRLRAGEVRAPDRIERTTKLGETAGRWQLRIQNADGSESPWFDFGVGMAVAPAPAAPAAAEPGADGQIAAFRLLRGGFRAVSGLIGKVHKEDYRVSTTVATIGIRGTDYWVYLCDSACAGDPTVAASAGVAGNPEGGLLLGVVHGGIYTANGSGNVLSELSAGNYQMVLPDGAVVNLPVEPRFVHVDPIPDPAACK